MSWLTPVEVEQQLLDCVGAALDAAGGSSIDRRCLVPGQVAWDDCQCGQLTVNEVRRYMASEFPTEAPPMADNCGLPWRVVQVLVTLARCVPAPLEDGSPPACEDLATAAAQLSSDLGVLLSSAYCCLNVLYNAEQLAGFTTGAQEVTGPQGGCVAGDLTVYLGFVNDCGCA